MAKTENRNPSPIAFAAANGAIYDKPGKPVHFFLSLFGCDIGSIPLSLGMVLCLAHAQRFGGEQHTAHCFNHELLNWAITSLRASLNSPSDSSP